MAVLEPSVREAMLSAVPSLRAFAISLSGNVDRADDLVQETLLRAMANINSFQPGTNMSAWLFTILRNLFRSEYRKRRREVEDTDGSYAETLTSHPEQHGRIEFEEFRKALSQVAARPARSADPGRRLGLLLRGGGRRFATARSAPSRAASTARARASPSCWRSTAPTISGPISRPARCCRPAAAADVGDRSACATSSQKNRPARAGRFFFSPAAEPVKARSASARGSVRRSPR